MALIPAKDLYTPRGHVLVTAPAVEPVTAQELRDHLRETTGSLPDSQAEELIAIAREMIEEETGLSLITQSWRLAFDDWPHRRNDIWWDGKLEGAISELTSYADYLCLPRYPLQSVTSVTVYGLDDAPQSITVADMFNVDTYSRPGRLALKYGQVWPIALRPTNAVEIVYVAGYGDTAGTIPAALRRAVKVVAAYLYAHRGDDCQLGDAMAGARSMVDQFKVARL